MCDKTLIDILLIYCPPAVISVTDIGNWLLAKVGADQVSQDLGCGYSRRSELAVDFEVNKIIFIREGRVFRRPQLHLHSRINHARRQGADFGALGLACFGNV